MDQPKLINWSLNNKLHIILLWVSLLFTQRIAFTQNLIVNGYCEIYDTCPTNYYNIDDVSNFTNFAYYSASEYLNSCSSSPYVGIPNHFLGYQLPHSGNGYIHSGLIMAYKEPRNYMFYTGSEYIESRENIKGEFTAPLKQNKIYKFEVYTNFTSWGDSLLCNDPRIATNDFDLLVFDNLSQPYVGTPQYINQENLLNLNPSGKIISDTANWTKLSVCFKAKGGETHFAIGSFRDTTVMQLKFLDCISPNGPLGIWVSSYYFDDFKLIECDTCCFGQFPYEDHLVVGGNPSGGGHLPTFQVYLQPNSSGVLEIYDSAGRLVVKETFTELLTTYQPQIYLAEAVYHYRFSSSNGAKVYGKVVVVE